MEEEIVGCGGEGRAEGVCGWRSGLVIRRINFLSSAFLVFILLSNFR
jgi:hypothetical protein